MRTCGILLPIFSLPTKFGTGTIAKDAYDFIDFLSDAGQGTWQILPIGPTGFGDSPYQPFSAFAGNPYFVDLESLVQDGLLYESDLYDVNWGDNIEEVDYGALYNNRYTVLRKAYDAFKAKKLHVDQDYLDFVSEEKEWLDDYCLYMTLKKINEGKSWQDWPEKQKTHDAKTLSDVRDTYADEIHFYAFIQYKFTRQWEKLHAYAKEKNITLIGDMPFYVSLDSADAWSHPEVFLMDSTRTPTFVAGCAPDAFSTTGQLWGNPIYDWKYLKKTKYEWWAKRIQKNYFYFDTIRIDHFHGFHEYYAVPYGDKTAENGTMEKGPGIDFFNSLKADGIPLNMIAEDLGTLTEENIKLKEDTGLPGMKILEYAFTSWNSIYITYRHEQNSVVYTGTHDNAPVREWLEEINDGERDFLRRFVNSMNTDYGALTWDIIREAYRSNADLCIIPLQDYLVKGKEARINTPGTSGNNWKWRLVPNFLSKELANSIRVLSSTYGRLPLDKK